MKEPFPKTSSTEKFLSKARSSGLGVQFTDTVLLDCHPILMVPDQLSTGGPREDPERVGARGKLLKLLPGSLFGEGSIGWDWDGSKKASEEEI